ncbi:hypothetical protein [Ottowia caeni]|uniref:hypothetical protein n=1 Tax=Ottowia caeni TaxID=2870339 RepID=UPI001E42DEBA
MMFYVLSWFVVFVLLALWFLAAWALHAVVTWTVANAGALSGAVLDSGALALPEWLAPWVPPELVQVIAQLIAGLGPVVDTVLQAAPALAGVLTVATWGIWGIGSVLLILLGVGMHLLLGFWLGRGRDSGALPPNQPVS